ncbi:hypothetical protein [Paenibacillus hunanensis]|uniref:YfhD family protein n=1 Tax=Paenibacillus hunanensis TaxID=539262 RepID=A0ABU1J2H6_9BACL|nr:hypothetical protein [Paenibacillus hunanensis]MCL9660496.1 hypothetical protein [Paenibacillus hunanensis]MDR6245715.1 hypothetical protein [Paenibacillus hunanensis]WPP42861.1 hypothetical protein SK066_07955 [Paenibacillus hunanensis]GGJ19910.1 hypothetical protein GCM10008022_31310 [Paenibacillus hunanensis]
MNTPNNDHTPDNKHKHDDEAFEQGTGAGVDPIPEPDPHAKHRAADLLEEAVDESVEKLEDDFTSDKDKHKK